MSKHETLYDSSQKLVFDAFPIFRDLLTFCTFEILHYVRLLFPPM